MKNRRSAVGIWLCMLLGPVPLAGAPCLAQSPIWAPPALNELIEEGLSRNQSINSLRLEVAALADQVPVAGALPDPMLGVGLLNMPTDTFDFDQEPMTQKQIALEQQIPWPGKLDLRSRMAAQDAGGRKALLDAEILSLAKNIADTYYELGYVGEGLRNNTRISGLMAQIKREAQDRYVVGRGLQNNIFQAEMELSRLSSEKIMLENRLRTLQDTLNMMLNRTPYQPVSPPADVQPADIPDFSLPEVKDAVLNHNPEVAARRYEISRAEAAVELARKDYLPDMNFRLAYGQREEDLSGRDLPDFVSASVMVNLPVWHRKKQDKNLSSALNRLQAARSAYEHLENTLPHRVDALAVELADTRQRLEVADELIPQARQWARSANDAYEVGQVEFDTMIRARMQVLNHELEAARLRFNLYQKLAALEQLVGRPVADIAASGNMNAPEENNP